MKRYVLNMLGILVVLSMVLVACGPEPTAPPEATAVPAAGVKVVVIGKSVHPYWSNVEKGVIAGYPVVDVKAVVYDGKEHPVDSKDIAFQIAGREVFKKVMMEASTRSPATCVFT